MAKVDLRKTVYNRNEFDKVVGDRNFTTFTPPTEDPELTVDEFFQAYEDLFLTIPVNGSNKSHEYLIRRSSELVGFQRTTEDIQPLLDEISSLRQQLLEARQDNLLNQVKTSGAGSELNKLLEEILQDVNNTGVEIANLDSLITPSNNPQ